MKVLDVVVGLKEVEHPLDRLNIHAARGLSWAQYERRDLPGRQRGIVVQVHGTLLHLNAQGCSAVGPGLVALAFHPLTAAVGSHRCKGWAKMSTAI